MRTAVTALSVLLLLAVAAPAAATADTPPREFAPVDRPGPALSESPADLAAAISCTADVATAEHPPVLLTAGTTVSSAESFSWNWIPALQDAGFGVCTVDPPGARQNMGDHQVRAEHVVHAIRHAYAAGGERPIGIYGHSQGGQIMRWALRFWPDTRPMVSDVISAAATNHGSPLVRALCLPSCAPALWQQIDGSDYIRALNSGQETFAGIDYTQVYTLTDEFVQPNLDDSGTSSLRTGDGRITNVAVQDICPLLPSEHLAVGTYDPVTWALGLDALLHDGPADPSRLPADTCSHPVMPGVDLLTFATDFANVVNRVTTELLRPTGRVAEEPPLRCYVVVHCAGPDAAPPAPEGPLPAIGGVLSGILGRPLDTIG